MTPSDDLFRLIRSLTPNEKRYFKVFASRHVADGQTNYMLLFDAIDLQQEYDETLIKEQFDGENFVKHLPSEKRYLQQLILKAMRVFHANSDIDAELNTYLDEAWFLMLKGLYDMSAKVLKKAEDIAIKHHRYAFLISFCNLRILQSQKAPAKERVQLMDEVITDFHVAAEHMDVSMNLNVLKFKLFHLQGEMHALTETERIQALQPLKDQYLQYPLHKDANIDDRLNKHQCQVYIAVIENNLLSAQKAHQEIVNLWQQVERHPINQNRFRKSLINLMNININLNDFNDFDRLLTLAEQTPSSNDAENARAFNAIGTLKIVYAMNTGQWETGVKYATDISNTISEHERLLQSSQILTLRGNLAMLYLFTENYNLLIDQVQAIYATSEDKSTRTDIRDLARILECIAHYELGNIDILDSLTRSAYRYLSKNNRLTPFLRFMINQIKRLPSIQDKDNRIKHFSRMYEELIVMKNEENILGVHEIMIWCQSKITGNTMQHIFAHDKTETAKAPN